MAGNGDVLYCCVYLNVITSSRAEEEEDPNAAALEPMT